MAEDPSTADRVRLYLKSQIAKDGMGAALGVLKSARGPDGEQLSTTELEIELLDFFFAGARASDSSGAMGCGR